MAEVKIKRKKYIHIKLNITKLSYDARILLAGLLAEAGIACVVTKEKDQIYNSKYFLEFDV